MNRRSNFLPFLALVGGLLGAFLRGKQLVTGFELGTALAIPGNLYGRALVVLALVLALLGALGALSFRACQSSFELSFCGQGVIFRGLGIVVGTLLIASGALWLYFTHAYGLEAVTATTFTYLLEYPYGVLSILCGLAFAGLSAAQATSMDEYRATLTIVPMFWGAFQLLVSYRIYCVSPNEPLFVIEFLAEIAEVLAFYELARFLYGKPKPMRFALTAFLAVVFGLTDSVGNILNPLMGGASVVPTMLKTWCRTAGILLGALFLLMELALFCRNQQDG